MGDAGKERYAAGTSGKAFREEQAGEEGCKSRRKEIVAERQRGKRWWDTLRGVRGQDQIIEHFGSHVTELISFTV